MATVSPATSEHRDRRQPASAQGSSWSSVPRTRMVSSAKALYAVSDRSVTSGTLAALLVAFALLNTGDLASTYMGLLHGLNEGNPLMSSLLARFGFGALIADKVLVIAAVTGGAFLLRRFSSRMANLVALVCDALVLVVVLSNVVQYALLK